MLQVKTLRCQVKLLDKRQMFIKLKGSSGFKFWFIIYRTNIFR